MMTKEKAKELALISSYIVREDLLYGTVFQTFDIAYSLAEEFYEIYEEGETGTIWGVEIEWDETLEKFVNERYLNGKKIEL
jgi:hypothetical protein